MPQRNAVMQRVEKIVSDEELATGLDFLRKLNQNSDYGLNRDICTCTVILIRVLEVELKYRAEMARKTPMEPLVPEALTLRLKATEDPEWLMKQG